MKITPKHLATIFCAFVLAACGGSPIETQTEGAETTESDDGVLDAADVPTSISVSGDINNEQTLDFDGTTADVQVILADIIGNPVTPNRTVEFASPEMGHIPDSCTTDELGCSVDWTSSGDRGNVTARWVTVLVTVAGAEPFEDTNNNRLYDEGETYCDLSEPWVDRNKNGTFENGTDFYQDLNSNGVFDTGNGEWDGPCSFSTGDCSGNSEARLFDWHYIYLCPGTVGDEDPEAGCDPEESPPSPPAVPVICP